MESTSLPVQQFLRRIIQLAMLPLYGITLNFLLNWKCKKLREITATCVNYLALQYKAKGFTVTF